MRLSGQTLYIAIVALLCVGVVGYVVAVVVMPGGAVVAQTPRSALRLDQIPFDGAAAYKNLQQICALGGRVSGTAGMTKQQDLLTKHFTDLGAKVERQEWVVRHPQNGGAVTMVNLIVQWHPDRMQRILVSAHYDTRPFPDRDPRNPRGTFLGANDGASGVALLMELGRQMTKLEGKLGVDFILFDGEELVFRDPPDPFFLGSTHFARQYVANPPKYKYREGLLLDMVADTDLQIYLEQQSQRMAPQVTQAVWNVARRLGVREFVYQPKFEVNDDHVPLNEIARIPTADVIDFDYPYWHTTQDAPNRCSALSLAKVGWVVAEWLKEAVK